MSKNQSRRDFARALAAAAVTPLALPTDAPAQDPKIPRQLLETADAQVKIVQSRFGKFLTAEQMKEVVQSVIRNRYSADVAGSAATAMNPPSPSAPICREPVLPLRRANDLQRRSRHAITRRAAFTRSLSPRRPRSAATSVADCSCCICKQRAIRSRFKIGWRTSSHRSSRPSSRTRSGRTCGRRSWRGCTRS